MLGVLSHNVSALQRFLFIFRDSSKDIRARAFEVGDIKIPVNAFGSLPKFLRDVLEAEKTFASLIYKSLVSCAVDFFFEIG